MPHTSRISSVVLSLMAALSAAGAVACGDDASGTGGAGGEASSSTSGSTTGSSASSTSSGDDASSSSSGEQGGGDAGGGDAGGGDAGGGQAGGGGAGGEEPACTPDEPPDARCEDDEDVGQTCQVQVAGGGCPDTNVIWRCTSYEGGPFWYRTEDTQCFCSVEGDEESCTALPGCVWADPPAGMCNDDQSDGTPIPETGCYRDGCGSPGFGFFGLVDDTCSEDLCSAFPPD